MPSYARNFKLIPVQREANHLPIWISVWFLSTWWKCIHHRISLIVLSHQWCVIKMSFTEMVFWGRLGGTFAERNFCFVFLPSHYSIGLSFIPSTLRQCNESQGPEPQIARGKDIPLSQCFMGSSRWIAHLFYAACPSPLFFFTPLSRSPFSFPFCPGWTRLLENCFVDRPMWCRGWTAGVQSNIHFMITMAPQGGLQMLAHGNYVL